MVPCQDRLAAGAVHRVRRDKGVLVDDAERASGTGLDAAGPGQAGVEAHLRCRGEQGDDREPGRVAVAPAAGLQRVGLLADGIGGEVGVSPGPGEQGRPGGHGRPSEAAGHVEAGVACGGVGEGHLLESGAQHAHGVKGCGQPPVDELHRRIARCPFEQVAPRRLERARRGVVGAGRVLGVQALVGAGQQGRRRIDHVVEMVGQPGIPGQVVAHRIQAGRGTVPVDLVEP